MPTSSGGKMPKHKGRKQSVMLERILDLEPAIRNKLASQAPDEVTIMGLQRKPLDALMACYPSLDVSEARRLKARLDVTSAAMMRGFRERRLSAQGARAGDEIKGPLAQSSGPTFENQFLPSWANNADPQAVDATTSPAAYLIDMLMFASEHVEAQGDAEKILCLKDRRPDLFELLLDEQALRQQVSQVEVVNHVLERAIPDSPVPTPVEDRLLQVRTPLKQFPYETYWEQIRTVLAHNQLSLSHVSRLSDVDSPYFIQPGASSLWSAASLQQDASLGPALRAILIEPPYAGATAQFRYNPQTRRMLVGQAQNATGQQDEQQDNYQFFTENFGVDYPTLMSVVRFCQAMQMTQVEMESLFGLAAHAPVMSDNVDKAAYAAASAGQFGARFINSGGQEAVSVASEDADPSRHYFQHLTQDRCDRVQRLVRLAQALKLPYAHMDQVVCAAIDAEHQAHAVQRAGRADEASPLWMSANTLRALGLFQFLRERFACSAEDFAALLSNMAIYGVGDTPSHFDRVFNSDKASLLHLDDGEFGFDAQDLASKRTIDQLCRALGINMETFRYLSRVILQNQGQLRRSLPTISAFYRMTLLARLLSITTIELLSLLEVVSPEGHYALQLGGTPRNAMQPSLKQSDAIAVIHALCSCVLWCQEQQMPISWLVQQLLPIVPKQVVSEEIVTLLQELKSGTQPFQDLDRDLHQAGVTPLRTQAWGENLRRLIDAQGLATDANDTEEDLNPGAYERFVDGETRGVIWRLMQPADEGGPGELPDLSQDEVERLAALIVSVVLRIRLQQWSVVQVQLAKLLSITSDLVIPVLYWAGGSVQVLLQYAQDYDASRREANPEDLDFISLIERMRRCREVVTRFALSPLLLTSLLMRAEQPRFSLRSTELTLHTLYYLERYTHCVRQARQTEEALLGYFSLVEALGELSANETRLIKEQAGLKIADWLGWGVREVLDVATQVSSDGILRNLAQLNVVMDTRQLSEKTGLSAASLLKLSRLSSHASTQAFREVAQEMLSSLRREKEQRRDEAELRQSLTAHCLVSKARLIAKPDDDKEVEETTVTLKLLDLSNVPVPEIRVRWSTTLGTLLDDFSYTDQQGVATVTLRGGSQVGVANVTATYLLDTHVAAPPIIVDCDENSLKLGPMTPKPRAPWQPAGEKGVYHFSVQMMDDYGNIGVDRLVNWASSIGEFTGTLGETLTDSQGYSRISLRSPVPAEGQVTVWYPGNPGAPEVHPVQFSSMPFIDSLLLSSWAVVGDPIVVKVTVREQGGAPAEGRGLQWTFEGGEVVEQDAASDAQGEARATLMATQAGPVTVKVMLVSDDDSPQPYVSEALAFAVLADANLDYAKGDIRWPPADGISASEYEIRFLSSDGQPVVNYPITWSSGEDGAGLGETLTGQDGIARFALKSEVERSYQVTAQWHGTESWPFEPVEFTPALELQILFDDEPVNGAIIIEQPSSGTQEHRLTYRLPADGFWAAQPLKLLYSGRYSDRSLGLSFEPGLGAENRFTDVLEMTWTITCTASSLQQAATSRLGLSHEHAWQAIWTDVVVRPPRR